MNNKEINALRARINRVRKTVDGIGKAAHAVLLDLDDMNGMLDDMVSNNLWATKPKVRVGMALTDDEVIDAVRKMLDQRP